MKYLYTNKDWQVNKNYNIDILLYSMIDRPDEVYYDGTFVWLNNKNEWHRDYDLPSYVDSSHLSWYVNSNRRKNLS